MVKREIRIDESWPVFSLHAPRNEEGPFVVEINDDFYKEYCYFQYKYHEYQLRLQVIYEHQQRIEYGFPEGSIIDDNHESIRTTQSTEAKV